MMKMICDDGDDEDDGDGDDDDGFCAFFFFFHNHPNSPNCHRNFFPFLFSVFVRILPSARLSSNFLHQSHHYDLAA